LSAQYATPPGLGRANNSAHRSLALLMSSDRYPRGLAIANFYWITLMGITLAVYSRGG
jgi:hypothetical protein